MVLFIWGRWRYDLVAVFALLAVVLTGLVPAQTAFNGFAHPAVLTVIGVLILSRGLQNAGIIDMIVKLLGPLQGHPALQLTGQTIIITTLSAFMNNVGALALMLPVAIRTAYRDNFSPALVLMPLAFASLLGGTITLIGTPPNLIVSSFREDAVGRPFAMFDFAPVGVLVAIAGILFLVLVGWRLIPQDRRRRANASDALRIEDYIAEVVARKGARAIARTVGEIERLSEEEAVVVALVRGDERIPEPRYDEEIVEDDILHLQGSPEALKTVIDEAGLALLGHKGRSLTSGAAGTADVVEAIVSPRSSAIGHTPASLRLRGRFGANLLAISRHGRRIRTRLRDVTFKSGDAVLLHGARANIGEALTELHFLPLAERDIGIMRPRRLILASSLFVGAILATMLGLMPVHIAFILAAALMVGTDIVTLNELYDAIDWPVVVLIGAMFPIGTALETTGTAALVANGLLSGVRGLAPVWALLLLLIATLLLTDFINNSATALVMSPIAVSMSGQLGTSPDPFLMAVAVGSSCAFLTPIGHQNNALILEPGGYRFGDYWRMGLPLEIVVVIVSVPAIMVVWPF
nr:SLC13 family permease [Pseudaminobacter soli]